MINQSNINQIYLHNYLYFSGSRSPLFLQTFTARLALEEGGARWVVAVRTEGRARKATRLGNNLDVVFTQDAERPLAMN